MGKKCPRGCEYVKRYGAFAGERRPAELNVIFKALSKSGKTLYAYFQCPKCQRIFKKGYRISKWKEPKEKES